MKGLRGGVVGDLSLPHDPTWAEYLHEVEDHGIVDIQTVARERTGVRRIGRTKASGEITVTVEIPVAWFVETDDPNQVIADVARETYLWGMKKYGWPEPPPLPDQLPRHPQIRRM